MAIAIYLVGAFFCYGILDAAGNYRRDKFNLFVDVLVAIFAWWLVVPLYLGRVFGRFYVGKIQRITKEEFMRRQSVA